MQYLNDLNFESPLTLVASLFILSLIPFFLISFTSFIKISVVYGLLRNALGAQQVPSAVITSVLSFVLTAYIMAPVFQESLAKVSSVTLPSKKSPGIESYELLFMEGSKPFDAFLRKHSHLRERVFFAEQMLLQNEKGEEVLPPECADFKTCVLPGETFFTLLPSFVLSELAEAFSIGFLLFLPFLVIDLLISNVLTGLGMMMVNPMSISLPFKLILFVLSDGWFALSKGLILSYS